MWTCGNVRDKKRVSSPIWPERAVGGEENTDFKNGGFLERVVQLLSRISGVRTVGSLRAKKQSCSPRQGLRLGTGFGSFRQTR